MSNDLQAVLVDNHTRLEAALPAHINVGDFVRLALTEVQRNPKLAQCDPQPGYRLFIDLARRSGEVLGVEAHVVYENDDFALRYGTDPALEHTPTLTSDPGKPLGAYAVAHLKGGGVQVEFMRTDEIEKARDAGAKNSPAWVTWWSEMAKKVVLRRASKLWPLSVEHQRTMDQVVTLDNAAQGFDEGRSAPAMETAVPLLERAVSYTDAAD